MQQQKKSKIIVISIVNLLIGYGINQLFQSKKQKDQIKIAKYILSMFLVGFSLALPLYLYDNYEKI